MMDHYCQRGGGHVDSADVVAGVRLLGKKLLWMPFSLEFTISSL